MKRSKINLLILLIISNLSSLVLLSGCASECANEKISQRNNKKYGRTVKHNNSNAFNRQNAAQFRGARGAKAAR
jgi:hypothetical protein